MKCKKCGYQRAKFVVSRKRYWKGVSEKSEERGVQPRKDFRVKCSKCGAEYVEKPKEETENEVSEEATV